MNDTHEPAGTDGMLCPSRQESPASYLVYPGPDEYRPSGGLVGQPRGCSYCGSLPPDDFMTAVRDGAAISPTDKNYKAYIQLPGGEAKFYFQHLAEDQRREFFEMYRDNLLVVGYPGHFYVLPFFIAPAQAEEAQ